MNTSATCRWTVFATLLAAPAMAQSAPSSAASPDATVSLSAPMQVAANNFNQPGPNVVSPKLLPGNVPKPVLPSGYSGPLGWLAGPLADHGVTLHALALNFAEANPSVGVQRGYATNSLYVIAGVDVNLGKLAGLDGLSLHFENVFFPATENLNIANQIGDSQVGYQPAYTPRLARLSRATIEDKALGGKLDVEAGITHPAYYYALFNCDSIASCFQDILYINAGYTSYDFAVPGANIAYQLTPNSYAQIGAFAVSPNANAYNGYSVGHEPHSGGLAMAELGTRTVFKDDPYPYTASITAFYNSSDHTKYNELGATRTVTGTSGFVLQADKVVWRRDGGRDPANLTPTALKLYVSAGRALDSTMPLQSDVYFGATLLSPFKGRPADRFGVRVGWERMNRGYTNYLTEQNGLTGGYGRNDPFNRDSVVLETNAHLQLPLGLAIEPMVQYEFHPNNYYNASQPTKAHDGVFAALTAVVPLGGLLGLTPHS